MSYSTVGVNVFSSIRAGDATTDIKTKAKLTLNSTSLVELTGDSVLIIFRKITKTKKLSSLILHVND